MKNLILLLILFTFTVSAQYMSDDEINKTMIATAEHYSKNLPMKIDQASTLIKIYAGLDRDLIYVYSVKIKFGTLRDGEIRDALVPLIEEHYREMETNNYCSQSGLLKIFRDQNITLEHHYVDENSKYLFDVRLSVKDCN
ncbi:MAG: hypothetical protein VYA14_00380 [Pseudomonadota bacterium]|nr:hypothetical protein [Pseudomonadota bacterium]